MISSWPSFDDSQINAASSVLSSGLVNAWTGNQTSLFEQEFAQATCSKYAVAVSNGTVALELAYRSLGLGSGDEVITTPRTFIATSSALVNLGVKPIFADVDAVSGCITPSSIEPLISSRTKAISVVHLGGWPADMPAISDLAHSYGLNIIEDCAQAHGACINGQSVGSFADVSAWSFCQDKIMTTAGEGGMVVTSRSELRDNIWSFKDHGKTLDAVFLRDHPSGYRWLHERFGTNFRLTEFQSAIGRIQLQRLSDWTAIRTRNAQQLALALSDCSVVRVPLPPDSLTHAWYKFYAFVKPEALAVGWSRDRILSEIVSRGYPAFSGSCSEIYLEKCFLEAGLAPSERLPVARSLGETSLMFLVHPTISLDEISRYAEVICSVLKEACR